MTPEPPIRLGYFLVLSDVASLDMRGAYRGVDRVWFGPIVEDDGSISGVSEELARLWDRYSEAKHSKELNTNRWLVTKLASQFREHDIVLNVIYTEISAVIEGSRDLSKYELFDETAAVWRGVHDSIEQRPQNLEFVGYDVSSPFPSFHSAIYQPGLPKDELSLADLLNDHGLPNRFDDALFIGREANKADYGPYPFCVLGVWNVT